MTDKLVTHDDLALLKAMRDATTGGGATAALLDRLIAAAEADVPPLPEGWVLYTNPYSGESRVLWHTNGRLSAWTDGGNNWGDVAKWQADRSVRLSPLRPTVTEADIERAVHVAIRMEFAKFTTERWAEIFLAAFKAAGIEVADS